MIKLPIVLLGVVGVVACQSPVLIFSGGTLSGPVIDTDSFSFANQYMLLQLEVRPEDPYSVILRVLMHDSQLYIDAAERRRWHKYLKQNPNVRVKLGDSVYLATAVRVDDPEITKQFLAGRTIYQLVPRRLAQSSTLLPGQSANSSPHPAVTGKVWQIVGPFTAAHAIGCITSASTHGIACSQCTLH